MVRAFIYLLFLFSGFFLSAGEVFILQTTDLHGIVHNTKNIAGAPSVIYSAAKDATRLGRDKTILVDCGDLLQGSLESADNKGEDMINLLNAARYDVWVPGNHDFEFGSKILSERIKFFRGATLAANLHFPNVGSYRIFQKNGYRISVIGMTNPHLHQWFFHPEEEGFHILPVEISYRRALQFLLREKPDAIILAIHSGIYPSKRLDDRGLNVFARRHPEVKIILGGHTHEKVVCKELGGAKVYYFQAGAHGGGYLRIRLNFDDNTRKLLEVSGEYVPVAPKNHAELPKAFRPQKAEVPLLARNFPVNPSREKLAEMFGKAIVKAHPHVKGVFHGALTTYRPRTKFLNRIHLFRICPFENRVLIANINFQEWNAILKEQKEAEKYGMKQLFFPEVDVKVLWASSPHDRFPFAFNSYAASGAGGRFPVLKAIIDNPAARAVLTRSRIFDLMETYIKEVYK